MTKNKNGNLKTSLLKEKGSLNKNAEKVKDELFQKYDFFDPQDLIQVKYEMIRQVQKDGFMVSRASKTFGFSRPSFYEIQNIFEKEGLPGLIPRQRGPKSAHKLSNDVMDYVDQVIQKDQSLRAADLCELIEKRFGFKVHPRSVERAMARRKKK